VSPAVVIAVRVLPRSSRDAIEAVDDAGELHVRVAAPPADGAANAAVTRLVARSLGLPRSAVVLERGGASRHKRLRLEGISAEAVRRTWPRVRVSER
jgi:uncharacterized protein